MLVLVACDLPFSSPTSLLPLGIHPSLSNPWNTSTALLHLGVHPVLCDTSRRGRVNTQASTRAAVRRGDTSENVRGGAQ
jgi:hypothetical protein